MILIFSSEDDQSTSNVIDWLIYSNKKFLRFNDEFNINVSNVYIDSFETEISFTINNINLKLSEIKSVWYRRGFFKHFISQINTENDFSNYIKIENDAPLAFLYKELEKKSKINCYSRRDINKMIQIESAKKNGLNIPDTLITKSKKNLSVFFRKKKVIISKSIQGQFTHIEKDNFKQLFTENFSKSDIIETSEHFQFTKFQKKISKEYELRIFFLSNKLYPMAIFSQSNIKTQIDFRNYDLDSPNRFVPFILPSEIQSKLIGVMKDLKLKSGSIDMLVNELGKYIFLEVNPVGQFGMVSMPCNYSIEKNIAKIL